MNNKFLISGFREKRSSVVGQIVELPRERDRLQADIGDVTLDIPSTIAIMAA